MKKIKILIAIICALALTLSLTACSSDEFNGGGEIDTNNPALSLSFVIDQTDSLDQNNTVTDTITFNGSTAVATSSTVNGSVVTITHAGVYQVSGNSDNGQLVVNAKGETVQLILNNLNLTNSSGSAILVYKAEKVVITLADGSTNTICDTVNYVDFLDESPTATIYSKSDLTINGNGTLNVNANYNNAIQSKDTLKILGGVLNITSVDDGIVGKDALYLTSANITLKVKGDALRSTNEDDATVGSVVIKDGVYNLIFGGDGIQGNNVQIDGGNFTIHSTTSSSQVTRYPDGGTINPGQTQPPQTGASGTIDNVSEKIEPLTSATTDNTTDGDDDNDDHDVDHDNDDNDHDVDDDTTTNDYESADEYDDGSKGVKATLNLTINGGIFDIDTSDDSIHSNGTVSIGGGQFQISSGDDGIHADGATYISGGQINVKRSYEGIEGASVTILAGSIAVNSSDDGLNAVSDDNTTKAFINIKGGNITVNASGDGIDCNGSIYQSGGSVTVIGPSDNGNGALDYDTTYSLSGGTLCAIGSSGMAQNPTTSGNVYGFSTNVSGAKGTLVITDSNGNTLFEIDTNKTFSNVIFASYTALTQSSSYTITLNGTKLTTVKAGTLSGQGGLFPGGGQTPGGGQNPGGGGQKPDKGQPGTGATNGGDSSDNTQQGQQQPTQPGTGATKS